MITTAEQTVTLKDGKVAIKAVPEGWRLLGPDEYLRAGDRIAYMHCNAVYPFDDWDTKKNCDAYDRWANNAPGRRVGNDEFRVLRPIGQSTDASPQEQHDQQEDEHAALLKFFSTPVGQWKGWKAPRSAPKGKQIPTKEQVLERLRRV